MNTKKNSAANYFPGLSIILNHPKLTDTEKIIAFAYCSLLNPWLKYQNSRITYKDIAAECGYSVDTVKRSAPRLFIKLPEIFKRNKKRFGGSYEYKFVYELKRTITDNINVPVITESIDEEKLLILQKLGSFPKEYFKPLLRYSLTEIKARTNYLLRQMDNKGIGKKSKYQKLHFNYIKRCFDEQWNIQDIRDLNKDKKNEICKSYDDRINNLLDGFIEKSKFNNKGAA